jgi:predicted signal transduction protein with EAL and GGDEF domain
MPSTGVAARLGGDEFALLSRHPPADPLAAATVLDRPTRAATVAGHRVTPRVSLGLGPPAPRLTGRQLLAATDTAPFTTRRTTPAESSSAGTTATAAGPAPPAAAATTPPDNPASRRNPDANLTAC